MSKSKFFLNERVYRDVQETLIAYILDNFQLEMNEQDREDTRKRIVNFNNNVAAQKTNPCTDFRVFCRFN